MQVKSADYSPAHGLKDLLAGLLARSEAREKGDKGFQCLQEEIAEARLQRQTKRLSLDEAERRRQRAVQDARLLSCEGATEADKDARGNPVRPEAAAGRLRALRDDGLQADERNLAAELADDKARKSARDVLLDEAVHILGDEAGLLEPPAGFAVSAGRPPSPAQ